MRTKKTIGLQMTVREFRQTTTLATWLLGRITSPTQAHSPRFALKHRKLASAATEHADALKQRRHRKRLSKWLTNYKA
jgi:hypothetical protein